MSTHMLLEAVKFAVIHHGEQKRKYTNEPYVVHPLTVAQHVQRVLPGDDAVVAAVLHDVLEDTDANIEEMSRLFGVDVMMLVLQVTDVSTPEDGNRRKRKEIDRAHAAMGSPRAKTIKLADLIDNTASILEYDQPFAKVYMAEKRDLLPYLKDGDSILFREATETVDRYFSDISAKREALPEGSTS